MKRFEAEERLLPNCWTVVRVDGRGFARFVDAHRFNRPNDDRGIRIMNKAAAHLMADAELNDIVMGFGNSDEFSFVLSRRSELFGRRSSKIVSTFASAFSSAYVFFWKECFPDTKLEYPPVFDCRVVLYPTDQNLRDYLAWRQADCHINNLYNTCFWSLVNLAKKSPAEAEEALRVCEMLSFSPLPISSHRILI